MAVFKINTYFGVVFFSWEFKPSVVRILNSSLDCLWTLLRWVSGSLFPSLFPHSIVVWPFLRRLFLQPLALIPCVHCSLDCPSSWSLMYFSTGNASPTKAWPQNPWKINYNIPNRTNSSGHFIHMFLRPIWLWWETNNRISENWGFWTLRHRSWVHILSLCFLWIQWVWNSDRAQPLLCSWVSGVSAGRLRLEVGILQRLAHSRTHPGVGTGFWLEALVPLHVGLAKWSLHKGLTGRPHIMMSGFHTEESRERDKLALEATQRHSHCIVFKLVTKCCPISRG